MDKGTEKRLRDLAASSIVGRDIKAALDEIDQLRSLERQYTERLGEIARLCDTVIPWMINNYGTSLRLTGGLYPPVLAGVIAWGNYDCI